jgi:hypothetical protein
VTERTSDGGTGTKPAGELPFRIDPVTDLTELVSEKELAVILVDMIPRWEVFKISRAVHALRLWGPGAEFDTRKHPSPYPAHTFTGKELRDLLLDHEEYLRFVPAGEPLLLDTKYGVATRTYPISDRFEGQLGHVDQILCVCGELGLPTDTTIRTPTRTATVAELISESQARFDLGQELEWTAPAYAFYLTPQRAWTNRFGESFCFDDAAVRLLEQTRGAGPCYGTHVPYALICLYRVDAQTPILEPATRRRIVEYFREISAALVESQRPKGYWPKEWTPGVPAAPFESIEAMPAWRSESLHLLITTSHHLEWIALAPPELRPPRDSVSRAVAFMLDHLQRLAIQRKQHNYLPLSHAARGLCLMINKSPLEVLEEAPPAGISQEVEVQPPPDPVY